MTDSEIIKAYEEEISKPQNHYIGTIGILWNALDLINRQRTEIDRLNIDLKAMRGAANSWKAEVQRICKKEFDNIEIDIETVKSEAVRKFAEKLAIKLAANYSDKYCHWIDDTIYELVEEMGCNDG